MNYDFSIKLPEGPSLTPQALDELRKALNTCPSSKELAEATSEARRDMGLLLPSPGAIDSEPSSGQMLQMEQAALAPESVFSTVSDTPSAPEMPFSPSSVMVPLAFDDAPFMTLVQNGGRIDIGISLEIREDAIQRVLKRMLLTAQVLGGEVMDLQLARNVGDTDLDEIQTKWKGIREWRLRTDGKSALLQRNDEPIIIPTPSFIERHWKGCGIAFFSLLFILIMERLVMMLK